MKRAIKIIIAFIVAAFVGFGIVYLIKTQSSKSGSNKSVESTTSVTGSNMPSKVPVSDDSNSLVSKQEQPSVSSSGLVESIPPQEAPVINISAARVVLSVGKNTYYYTVSGIKSSGSSDGTTYKLSDSFGHTYTSNNGTFNRVVANNTGIYSVVAQDSSTGLSSEAKAINGFNIVDPIKNKLSASELSSLIATGDYNQDVINKLSGRMAKKVSINCDNSSFGRNTLAEVFMAVGLEGWNVTVSSLDYNCLGQVDVINLSATK